MIILEISVYFGNFRGLYGIWVNLEVLGNFCYFRDFECIFGHFRCFGNIFGNFGGFRRNFGYFRIFLVIRDFEGILVILEIWVYLRHFRGYLDILHASRIHV